MLIVFVVITAVVNLIIPAAIAKWAILAPIFVPLFLKLNVAPDVVLAAYRVGNSPGNVITPLMAYFGMIVIFAQKYQKERRRRHGRGDDAALYRRYCMSCGR